MIKGTKVGLRAVEEDDLLKLRDWRNIESFRKNFREVRELNLLNQKRWYDAISGSANDFMFSVIKLEDNELIGACGLLYTNWVIRSADFSFYIGKNEEYLDKDGFGGEAVRLLIEYGFNSLNLHKIWMELYEFDKLKLNFFIDHIGFKKDGMLRDNCFSNGKYYNSYIISLLQEEYNLVKK